MFRGSLTKICNPTTRRAGQVDRRRSGSEKVKPRCIDWIHRCTPRGPAHPPSIYRNRSHPPCCWRGVLSALLTQRSLKVAAEPRRPARWGRRRAMQSRTAQLPPRRPRGRLRLRASWPPSSRRRRARLGAHLRTLAAVQWRNRRPPRPPVVRR